MSYSLSFVILLIFFLTAIYIGYRLVTRFFKLSFENVILNQKLENINKFLEQRVKERTLELENSLKLVTFQATHDLLTNLPNQRLLVKYMSSAIKLAEQNQSAFMIIFLHINEIDKINDGLGHAIGDLVIKIIAQRFQDKFHPMPYESTNYIVTLSRKDVFVILVDSIKDAENIEQYVKPIFSIFEEPIDAEKQLIKLTVSLGISLYPKDGKKVNVLLMNADAAMWHARQHGGNHYNVYRNEINADTSKQLELASGLHSALLNTEFMLHYQPFVSLETGEICGAEALVRWQHPVFGMIAPDKFIPLAEANGIILPLGEWVLRTACHQLQAWHGLGFHSLKIAVNLSARQLLQKNIIQTVTGILAESHLSPEFLELELTESEAFKRDIIPILKQLKTLGISLSIDDFGTGYSGLSNLKLITIDKLKIDKSFVQDITANEQSRIIIANTISMARKLNITVTAEGIETLEQALFLKEHHCHLLQGYYFSRPISAEAFGELLKNHAHLQLTSSS
ncbi:hypothetical protein AYO45_02145 [Gammaproteobacteria bacterium SCGC AG-212-F23]|nr:hypothetical protein AYO45_02145 [Gammaproteobacteria bacterium SCGC AG-212-F23]